MRKPTRESREWNRIHEYKLNKRKHRRKKTTGAQTNGLQHRRKIAGLPGAHTRIPCPENLSLENNFEEVNKLISTIRKRSWDKKGLYIDL